jgi:energy-coupling factor transporter ATP-binding protein EcfA2
MKKIINVEIDEITKELSQTFDYEFNGESTFILPKLPKVPDEFGIGLIVGASGSGKSSLLENFGKEELFEWNPSKAICSQFESAQDAQEKLSSVGFNSIPSWMRPYHVLSTGEKFRADLAKKLKNNAVIDEFTSVVDRNVAKSCANSLRRYVDKKGFKNIVIASCHYDIVEWLQPDWVFDTATNRLTVGRGLLERPEIKLEILPCSTEAWAIFCKHHYLTSDINRSSRCWLAVWEGTLVGFTATIPLPSGTLKNAWKGHRTVVLPDFQGLGLGVRISDAIGEIFIKNGYRYFSKTAHVRLGEYRNNNSYWRGTTHNMQNRAKQYKKFREKTFYSEKLRVKHSDRVCYCHEYIGKKQA